MSRMERVNSELRKQISALIPTVKDPRVSGMISVLDVDCDDDLTLAKVYVSVLGAQSDARSVVDALNGAQGYLRSQLRSKVKIRNIPTLQFRYDDTMEYGMKINRILNTLDIPPADDGERSDD